MTTPAVDAVDSNYSSGTTTSLSWTHTPVASHPALTGVYVDVDVLAGTSTTVTVTYGSSSMTLVGSTFDAGTAGGSAHTSYRFELPSPPAGAQVVTVSISPAAVAVGVSRTFTGGDTGQVTRPGSYNGAAFDNVYNPSIAVTSAASDLVVDFLSDQPKNGTPAVSGAGQVADLIATDPTTLTYSVGASHAPGASSVTMSWTTKVAGNLIASSVQAPGGGALTQWDRGGCGAPMRVYGITSPTVVAAALSPAPGLKGSGTLVNIFPDTIGSSGTLTVNDCTSTSAASEFNVLFSIDAADITPGTTIELNRTFTEGLCISSVPAGSILGVAYYGSPVG